MITTKEKAITIYGNSKRGNIENNSKKIARTITKAQIRLHHMKKVMCNISLSFIMICAVAISPDGHGSPSHTIARISDHVYGLVSIMPCR